MSDKNTSGKQLSSRLSNKGGCLFAIAGFFGLMIIGYISTQLFSPERLAKANECVGPFDGTPVYQNTCSHEINFQYCLFSDAGPEQDICRDFALQPGEGVETLDDDLRQLDGLLRPGILACKAPYLPGQFVYWNTRRLTPGCVKPGDPLAGPHMTRAEEMLSGPDTSLDTPVNE